MTAGAGRPSVELDATVAAAMSSALWDDDSLLLVLLDEDLSVTAASPAAAEVRLDAALAREVDTLRRLASRNGGDHVTHVVRAPAMDGHPSRTFRVIALPLPSNGDGSGMTLVVGWSGATETSAHDEVREAQRWAVVGRVAYGVGHDLNNHLSTITTLSELLLMDAEADSTSGEDLREIKESAWQAAALTRRLELFAGGITREADTAEPTDVAAVVRDLEVLLRHLVGSRGSVEIEVPAAAPASVSKSACEEAILALAVEAREALRRGGTLRVEVAHENPGDGRTAAGLSIEMSGNGLGSATGIGADASRMLAARVGGRVDLRPDGDSGSVRIFLPTGNL